MSIVILPFSEEHVEEATSMVAKRRRAGMHQEPELPGSFLDRETILRQLGDMVGEKGAGLAAMDNGILVGFLVGFTSLFRGEPTAYSPNWGHAAESRDRLDIYKCMYASLADQWVSNGYLSHSVSILSHDKEAIDAWHSMGFGHLLEDAIRDVSPTRESTGNVSFRQATLEDVGTVMTWQGAIQDHLSSPPVFIYFLDKDNDETLRRWLSEPANSLWMACKDGELVGYIRMEPSSTSDVPLSDPETVCITGAFTQEDDRGTGIGTGLLNRALQWARSEGYKHCGVDYETANILGARFWSRRGFRPFCLSLNRRLDARIMGSER